MSKKRKKKIGKPNGMIYTVAYGISKLLWLFKGVKVTYDKSALVDLKGPALILCPHTCAYDPVFVGCACYPKRLTFVVSEHFLAKPLFKFLLTKICHVITKKMFCADASTIMNIMRAKNEGNIVVLFAEGRLNSVPQSHPVTPGTAGLVKKLGVDVYTVTANGSSLLYPKWSKVMRRGEVSVTTQKLFSSEDLKTMTVDEISDRIDKAILHDDEKAMQGKIYKAKDTTLDLDGVLYKCPVCGEEFCLISGDCHMTCTQCGFDTVLGEDYKFSDSCPYQTINEWYNYQVDTLDLTKPLESVITVGAIIDGVMNLNAGSGKLYLDKDKLVFDGFLFGEPLSFEKKNSDIGGMPYTPKREFDIYHQNRLLYLMPKDRKHVVKWTTYLDKSVSEQ